MHVNRDAALLLQKGQTMTAQAQLLARYQRLRQVGIGVNHTLVKRLAKDVLDEGGRELGILRKGVLVLESQDEIAVAALPVGVPTKPGRADAVLQLVEIAKSLLTRSRTPEETSKGTAALIRTCLQAGAASYIAYGEPGAASQPFPRQVGRPAPVR